MHLAHFQIALITLGDMVGCLSLAPVHGEVCKEFLVLRCCKRAGEPYSFLSFRSSFSLLESFQTRWKSFLSLDAISDNSFMSCCTQSLLWRHHFGRAGGIVWPLGDDYVYTLLAWRGFMTLWRRASYDRLQNDAVSRRAGRCGSSTAAQYKHLTTVGAWVFIYACNDG